MIVELHIWADIAAYLDRSQLKL